MSKPINVLSLFDGISCGQLALNRAGVAYSAYYASEISKHAIQVTQKNFPATIQLGDVTKIDLGNLPKIHLLLGGSPCQGFSFAGKQLNFSDSRSKLFFNYVDALKFLKPKYFLLENVVMKKEYEEAITDILGVAPVKIDSALFSAQSRKRLYWTNIDFDRDIIDRGVTMSSILEHGQAIRPKSQTILATIYKENAKSMVKRSKYGLLAVSPNGEFRKITPLECERLQTIPDNYTDAISNTRRYEALGNGWTVDVIAHILKGIK